MTLKEATRLIEEKRDAALIAQAALVRVSAMGTDRARYQGHARAFEIALSILRQVTELDAALSEVE